MFEEILSRDLRLHCGLWLAPADMGCLEAVSKEQQAVVAAAVPAQAALLESGGDMPPRHESESWPKLARFLAARHRLRSAHYPAQATIAAGGGPDQSGDHSAVVTAAGALFTFGTSSCGALGHGWPADQPADAEDAEPNYVYNPEPLRVPMRVAALAQVRVVSVACGALHTLALAAQGTVYSFGNGAHGELGHGDKASQFVPKAIAALEGVHVVSVAAGYTHSAAVAGGGELYTFGADDDPRSQTCKLGHAADDGKPLKCVTVPMRVAGASDVTAAACGSTCTAILTRGGEVMTIGGIGTRMPEQMMEVLRKVHLAPYPVAAVMELGCKAASIRTDSDLSGGPIIVIMESGQRVSVNPGHLLAKILDEGTDTMGGPSASQSLKAMLDAIAAKRAAEFPTNILSESDSCAHLALLTVDGCVLTSGGPWSGRLGQGPVTDYGSSEGLQQVAGLSGSRVVRVATGPSHTLVLTVDGDLYSCGCEALGYDDPDGGTGVFMDGGEEHWQCTPKKVEALPKIRIPC
jgi:hypothetical protein